MIDTEKLKQYRKEMEANGYWSSEAFDYMSKHIKEIDANIELHRICFPYLTEVYEMFKDEDFE